MAEPDLVTTISKVSVYLKKRAGATSGPRYYQRERTFLRIEHFYALLLDLSLQDFDKNKCQQKIDEILKHYPQKFRGNRFRNLLLELKSGINHLDSTKENSSIIETLNELTSAWKNILVLEKISKLEEAERFNKKKLQHDDKYGKNHLPGVAVVGCRMKIGRAREAWCDFFYPKKQKIRHKLSGKEKKLKQTAAEHLKKIKNKDLIAGNPESDDLQQALSLTRNTPKLQAWLAQFLLSKCRNDDDKVALIKHIMRIEQNETIPSEAIYAKFLAPRTMVRDLPVNTEWLSTHLLMQCVHDNNPNITVQDFAGITIESLHRLIELPVYFEKIAEISSLSTLKKGMFLHKFITEWQPCTGIHFPPERQAIFNVMRTRG